MHHMRHSLSRVVVPATLYNMLCSVAGTTTLDRECAGVGNVLRTSAYTSQTVLGGGSVMVWAGICHDGRTLGETILYNNNKAGSKINLQFLVCSKK